MRSSPLQPADTRRWYLALARRRAGSGSGSDQRLLRSRSRMYPVVDLRSIIRQTPFLVVGGIATRMYMPERMTVDVDILVLPQDAPALYRELAEAGCKRQGT